VKVRFNSVIISLTFPFVKISSHWRESQDFPSLIALNFNRRLRNWRKFSNNLFLFIINDSRLHGSIETKHDKLSLMKQESEAVLIQSARRKKET